MLRAPHILLAIASSLAACGGPGGIRDPQAFARTERRADSACAWSAARELLAGGTRPVYVEYPSAAPVEGGTMLLGSPSIVWGQATRVAPDHPTKRDSLFPAGVVLMPSSEVRQVADPSGFQSTSASPRVAPLDDGTALVLWGKRLVENGRVETPVRSIWAGRYDGHAWLAPQQVFADSAIEWDVFTSTSELVGARDTFSLVLRTSRPDRLVLLRYERGVWRTRVLPFFGSYVRLLALPGRLLLAYVYPDQRGSSVDALWVRGSSDGGVTWSEAIAVDRSVRRFHQDPVLRLVDDRVALVWQAHGESGLSDSLMLADVPAAAPLDSPWVRRPTLHVPSLRVGLSAVVAPGRPRSVLHVAFESGQAIGVAAWTGVRWDGVSVDAFPEAATPPTIVRLPDRLAVMWGVARDTPAGPEPVSLVATHAVGCTPR